MVVYVVRRVGLAVITMVLVSIIVFMTAQVLPGNVGRTILGPQADPRSVEVLNHQLGTDRPVLTQYADWVSHAVRGNFGASYSFQRPISDFVGPAVVNSLKLAAIAFVIVVMTSSVLPEFVTGLVLLLVLSIWLPIFPVAATAPPGSGVLDQIYHLILPALPLALLLFGYFARMARSGTIAVLQADYVRTAVLKGLPWRTVVWRHALRNSLLPTITVVANQLGYMIGGLIVVETLFRYNGLGSLVMQSAQDKDMPLLQASVLIMATIYLTVALVADLLVAALNPRIRLGGRA
jgi:peptide/nickel transport system permease protein